MNISEKTDATINRILEAMEGGKLAWRKPWQHDTATGAIHYNGASGHRYTGANPIILHVAAMARGFQSTCWLTFKQIKDLGGSNKGAKAEWILRPVLINKKDENGEKTDESFMAFNAYPVFNFDECTGIDAAKLVRLDVQPLKIRDVPNESAVLDMVQTVGASVHHGGNRAFYTPGGDYIQMPNKGQFVSAEHYDSTLAHETVHWTGAKHRLDRLTPDRFGGKDYAFEELVAELGAALIMAEFGVDCSKLESPAYLQNWIRLMTDHKAAFFKAATLASHAVEYIRDSLVADAAKIAA